MQQDWLPGVLTFFCICWVLVAVAYGTWIENGKTAVGIISMLLHVIFGVVVFIDQLGPNIISRSAWLVVFGVEGVWIIISIVKNVEITDRLSVQSGPYGEGDELMS